MDLTHISRKRHKLLVMKLRCCCVLGPVAVFSLTVSANLCAQDLTLELDPASTRIEFSLGAQLHAVHGTFAMKSGTIRFNPASGSASGSVVIDVKSGQSGNDRRDRKMHEEVLQSDQYPDATFTPTKMSGAFPAQGSSTIQVEGNFRIHGGDRAMTLMVPLQVSGSSVNLKAQVVIPYVQWGMKNPSTFILRVSDKVDLDIAASGRLTQDRHP